MGSIYPRFSKKTGELLRYQILYKDENGKWVYFRAPADKETAKLILFKLEIDVAKRKAGLIDPREEKFRDEGRRPAIEHYQEWQATRIECSEKHAKRSGSQVKYLLGVANIDRLSDLTRDKVLIARAKMKRAGLAHGTLNRYMAAIKTMTAWLHSVGRLREDPLAGIEVLNEELDRRWERRSIGGEAIAKLLAATEAAPKHHLLTGPQRALLYRVALSTGLRLNELRTLTAERLRLDGRPCIQVHVKHAKNRKAAWMPIPAGLAERLKVHMEGVGKGKPVFRFWSRGADMLKRDLKLAGIPYVDEEGKVFDFHALRGEFATLLDEAGVPMGVRQQLMRHSTPVLTARYTRPRDEQHAAAIGLLPPCITGESTPLP